MRLSLRRRSKVVRVSIVAARGTRPIILEYPIDPATSDVAKAIGKLLGSVITTTPVRDAAAGRAVLGA